MKNIKAFVLAFALFLLTAGGIHALSKNGLPEYHIRYGTWMEEAKYASVNGLKKLLDAGQTLPIFGSSELRHGQNSSYQGNHIFEGADMKPVFIGQAGYQSLTHAITMGALGESLAGRKAVLIISPQWFKEGGVKQDAFLSAFSEDVFIEFLENQAISKETKQYVVNRVNALAAGNEEMGVRIERDVKWYGEGAGNPAQNIFAQGHRLLIKERTDMGLFLKSSLCGMRKKEKQGNEKAIDFTKLYQDAEEEGVQIASHNEYGMFDRVYERDYQKQIESGQGKKPRYTIESEEYEDIRCFLEVCRANQVEPLVVMLPFNGYWYDYLKLTEEERQAIYDKAEALVKEFGAAYADLSGNEYEPYYFEDNSHPALKGLVDLNEQIYGFYKEYETK